MPASPASTPMSAKMPLNALTSDTLIVLSSMVALTVWEALPSSPRLTKIPPRAPLMLLWSIWTVMVPGEIDEAVIP